MRVKPYNTGTSQEPLEEGRKQKPLEEGVGDSGQNSKLNSETGSDQ